MTKNKFVTYLKTGERVLGVFILSFSLLLVVAGCKRDDGMTSFADNRGEFELDIPADWQIREGVPGVLGAFESPLDPNGDTFAENITVAAVEPEESATMAALLAEARMALEEYYTKFELVSEENFDLQSGLPSRKMVYKGSINSVEFKCGQVYVHTGSKVYTMTLTATPETYDEFEPVFLRSASTFKLK